MLRWTAWVTNRGTRRAGRPPRARTPSTVVIVSSTRATTPVARLRYQRTGPSVMTLSSGILGAGSGPAADGDHGAVARHETRRDPALVQPGRRLPAQHHRCGARRVGRNTGRAGGGHRPPHFGGGPAGAGVQDVMAGDAAMAPAPDPGARGGEPTGASATSSCAGPSGRSDTATSQGSPSGAAIRTSPPRLTSAASPVSASIAAATRSAVHAFPTEPRSSAVCAGSRIAPPGSRSMPRQESVPGASGEGAVPGRRARRHGGQQAEVAVVAQLHQGPAEQRVDDPVGRLGGLTGDVDRGDQQRVHLHPGPRRPVGPA